MIYVSLDITYVSLPVLLPEPLIASPLSLSVIPPSCTEQFLERSKVIVYTHYDVYTA